MHRLRWPKPNFDKTEDTFFVFFLWQISQGQVCLAINMEQPTESFHCGEMNKILAHTFFPPDESSSFFSLGPSHAFSSISIDRFLLFLHVAREIRVLYLLSVGRVPKYLRKTETLNGCLRIHLNPDGALGWPKSWFGVYYTILGKT